jgi:MFS family permease
MNSGGTIGYLAGIGIGGFVAAHYGWRSAFIAGGLTGLIIAIAVRFALPEPRKLLGFPTSTTAGGESLAQSARRLAEKPSFIWLLCGITGYTVFSYGESVFLPSFMMRSLHATLEQISVRWSLALAIANTVGVVVGGILGDRLGRKDRRWYAGIPATAYVFGSLLYVWALLESSLNKFIAIESLAEGILAVGAAVSWVAVHSVCGSQRRALAVAIIIFSTGLVGGGLGPLLTGAISDAFAAHFGNESLRASLLLMVGFLCPSALIFWTASRRILDDVEL